MTKITPEILYKVYPQTPKASLLAAVDPLNAAMDRYEIETATRVAAFIAQVGHESGGFARTTENLNYSAHGLLATFPKYFNSAQAAAYARQPQKIAARVYANRMGNGNEASGEGWTYRGRGYIQLTGKANYQRFADDMKIKLEEAVPYLESPAGAALSAGWFWNGLSLNQYADLGKFDTITQKINGGQNGADDRRAHFALIKKLLG